MASTFPKFSVALCNNRSAYSRISTVCVIGKTVYLYILYIICCMFFALIPSSPVQYCCKQREGV